MKTVNEIIELLPEEWAPEDMSAISTNTEEDNYIASWTPKSENLINLIIVWDDVEYMIQNINSKGVTNTTIGTINLLERLKDKRDNNDRQDS